MSALWVLPLVVLTVGAVAVAVVGGRLAAAVAELRASGGDLRRIAEEAEAARLEADAAWQRSLELGDVRRRFADTGRPAGDR